MFGKPRRNNGKGWLLILLLLAGIGAYYKWRPDPQIQIKNNQAKALGHLKEIMAKLKRWKNSDYDGNGRPDLPLGPLRILRESKLINGHAVGLLSEELCRADMRNESPQKLDGYYFTLTHPEHTWPSQSAMVNELYILARPAKPGISGSCTFFVSTQGNAFFSNINLPYGVPPWPDARLLEAKVWEVLPKEAWEISID